MGRKGVSKRKPKQANKGKVHPATSSAVQELMKGKEPPLNNTGIIPYIAANKKNKKSG